MIQIYGGGSVANWFRSAIKWLFVHEQPKHTPKHRKKQMSCPSKYPPSRNIVYMVKSNGTERILVMKISGNTKDIWDDIWQYPPPGQVSSPPPMNTYITALWRSWQHQKIHFINNSNALLELAVSPMMTHIVCRLHFHMGTSWIYYLIGLLEFNVSLSQ